MAVARQSPKPKTERPLKQQLRRAPRRTAEETRDIILRHASMMFSERGYLGTSVYDLAAASGVSKSNILYFFDNKDELWKSAVDYAYEQVNEFLMAQDYRRRQPTWENFEAFLARYLLACARYPAYVKIPMMEGSYTSWRTEWLASRHLARDIRWFREFLKPYAQAGMVPKGQDLELQALVSGGGQVLFVQAPLFSSALRRGPLDEAFAEQYARFVVSVIRGAGR